MEQNEAPCASQSNLSSDDQSTKSSNEEELECAVCLQTCIHPVKLPCSHIFCFLCVKGVANQSKRCAMCRQEIPADFLDRPTLLRKVEEETKEESEEYQWFYGGRNGWWQYDERTSRELEASFNSGQRSCEILVAGFLYTIDFDKMMQQRRNDPSRRRRIKRDLASIPKKGIAGLKTDGDEDNSLPESLTSSEANEAENTLRLGVQTPPTSESIPESTLIHPETELEQVHLLHSNRYRNNPPLRHRSQPNTSSRGQYSSFSNLPTLYDEEEESTSNPNYEEEIEINDLSTHLRNFRLDQDAQYYSLDDTEEYELPQ